MPPSLAARLREFTDPRRPEQLQMLDESVAEASARGLTQPDKEALLQVFERFPEEDGFGVFWSILHALEHADAYDALLVASVQRAPNLFNTLMVHRMINAGIAAAEGTNLRDLLEEVLRMEGIPPGVITQVQGLLQHLTASEA